MNDPNPYSPPKVEVGPRVRLVELGLTEKELKKVKAIISDANQVWIAILLCFLCSIVGAILIPIWYTVRLLQWNKLSKQHPILVQQDLGDELSGKFRSAQWKLIVGLVVGCLIFLGLTSYAFVAVAFL